MAAPLVTGIASEAALLRRPSHRSGMCTGLCNTSGDAVFTPRPAATPLMAAGLTACTEQEKEACTFALTRSRSECTPGGRTTVVRTVPVRY